VFETLKEAQASASHAESERLTSRQQPAPSAR
jgi:hypothetical protein